MVEFPMKRGEHLVNESRELRQPKLNDCHQPYEKDGPFFSVGKRTVKIWNILMKLWEIHEMFMTDFIPDP